MRRAARLWDVLVPFDRGGGLADAAVQLGAVCRMAFKPFDAEAFIDAAAPILQLPVPNAYRAGVRQNLKTAAKMAALLDRVELADEAEPAPVFRS